MSLCPPRVSWGSPRVSPPRRVLARLQAALELPQEDGDVPARVLAEHLMGSRRRQKLLLAQLRALRLLLGVLQAPEPPPTPPALRGAVAEARGRWRALKGGYGGALGALGGAVPPALAQLGRGRRLLQRLQRALGRPQREAAKRRSQEKVTSLQGRVTSLRDRVTSRRQALRRQEEAVRRVGARCRLRQALAGVWVLPPPTGGGAGAELELGPPPGLPDPPPALRVRGGRDGELSVVGGPPTLPPPLGPGLLELQERLWERLPLWAEVWGLQNRFALDWEPEQGRVRLLGGPGAVWTLLLDAGYPRGGGVRVLPPPGTEPPAPPSAAPSLSQWVELLAGTPL